MWDLRWVLLGLGALVLLGVYLWSKGFFRRRSVPPSLPRERTEPSIGGSAPATAPLAVEGEGAAVAIEPPRKASRSAPDRIITMRLIPRGEELAAERAVSALSAAGLTHGRYGIFHKDAPDGEPAFSVASLTEPGTFDLANLGQSTI